MLKRGRLALLIGLMVLTIAPTVDASRRSSLAGNLLIEDVKDIFFLPHEVTEYVNYVWFDFVTGGVSSGYNPLSGIGGGDGGSGGGTDSPVTEGTYPQIAGAGDPFLGSGGILFGNAADGSFGIGIATHRSDYQGALGYALGLGDIHVQLFNVAFENGHDIFSDVGDFDTGNAAPALDALDWVDVMAGFRVTDDIVLGTRVSLGSNIATRTDRAGDTEGVLHPGASANSFNFVVSGGFDLGSFDLDTMVELTTANFAAEGYDAGEDDELSDAGSAFGLGMAARGFYELTDSIDLGGMLAFQTRSRTVNLARSDDDRENLASDLMVGLAIGPRYRIGDEALVAAYVALSFVQGTEDPDGKNNAYDELMIMLPGINIAAEWYLTDWFTYRAGLYSQYSLFSDEQQLDDDTDGTSIGCTNADCEGQTTTSRSLFFYWSTGVGFNALEGDFNFDAMLNWPVITAGPNILSGQAQDYFGMATASYSF